MPTVLDHVDAERDLATGTWRVRAGAAQHDVREWTWGERRRLVSACVRPGPAGPELDSEAFLDGLVELLVAPPPQPAQRDLLAAVTLRLCGVVPGASARSLLQAEARLAREWGWGPAELDHQPAPRIDEHLRAWSGSAAGPAGTADGSGWTGVIVVDDDG